MLTDIGFPHVDRSLCEMVLWREKNSAGIAVNSCCFSMNFMFTDAERMFTDGKCTFRSGEHTFTIAKYKICRDIILSVIPTVYCFLRAD